MKKQLEVTAQTRQNLIDAFWSIYCEKRIEKISVKEIAIKAGYNRGTFYEYFIDVFDVLEQIENAMIPELDELPPVNRPTEEVGLPLDMFIRMYQQHSKYYGVLLGDHGDPSFQRKVKNAIRPLLKMSAGINGLPDDGEMDYILEYALSAMIGTMSHWFRQSETIPAGKLIALMYDLMQNGVMGKVFVSEPGSNEGIKDNIDRLATPSVLVDMRKVRDNLKRMADDVLKTGCTLRPHVKTHKIPELARLALAYGACGITVAKVSEAEVMADGGLRDIFIAYPLVGDFRIRRAGELSRRVRLILAVDSLIGSQALSDHALRENIVFEVRLEVDTGLRRTGIAMEGALALALRIAQMPGLRLTGIFTFRGPVLDGYPTTDNEAAGRQEGQLMAALAASMRAEGLDIIDVSGGSSPTGRHVAAVAGVTEVRPGTYIFNDFMQVTERTCGIDDCAASVLATVVSTPEAGYAIIDGGSKTFATDFPVNAPPYFFKGYAIAADNPDLVLTRVNEEHGIITSVSGDTGLAVGQRIRMIPTHICTTVNLHNVVWFIEEGVLRKVRVEARGMLV